MGPRALADLDFPDATEGLGDEIERRFDDDAELIETLRGATLPELWRRSAEKNSRLKHALEALTATNEQVTSNQAEPPPLEVLVSTAMTGPEDAQRAALVRLGNLRAAEAVEPAELAIRNGSIGLRRLGRRALFRAANPRMVPQARHWATESNELADVALRVLASYGESVDLEFLRASLESTWRLGHIYAACDAVEGLGRLADRESESTIETIYDETTYSYLRRRAARALAALSEAFAVAGQLSRYGTVSPKRASLVRRPPIWHGTPLGIASTRSSATRSRMHRSFPLRRRGGAPAPRSSGAAQH
jgi:hypothetical protein